jgi:CPA1 family monovalent cation:H+ antiporter
MSDHSRAAAEGFWEYVGFALNSIVFLLIGFEVRVSALASLWREIVLAFLAMFIARAGIVALLALAKRASSDPFPHGWPTILTWGGLRGALSLVLALSLPADIPNRATIVSITVGAVALSLILQGFTVPLVVARFGLGQERSKGGATRADDTRAAAAVTR